MSRNTVSCVESVINHRPRPHEMRKSGQCHECPVNAFIHPKQKPCLLPVFLWDGSHGHSQSKFLAVSLMIEGVLSLPHLALLQENVSLQRKRQPVNIRRQVQRKAQDGFSVNEWGVNNSYSRSHSLARITCSGTLERAWEEHYAMVDGIIFPQIFYTKRHVIYAILHLFCSGLLDMLSNGWGDFLVGLCLAGLHRHNKGLDLPSQCLWSSDQLHSLATQVCCMCVCVVRGLVGGRKHKKIQSACAQLDRLMMLISAVRPSIHNRKTCKSLWSILSVSYSS